MCFTLSATPRHPPPATLIKLKYGLGQHDFTSFLKTLKGGLAWIELSAQSTETQPNELTGQQFFNVHVQIECLLFLECKFNRDVA